MSGTRQGDEQPGAGLVSQKVGVGLHWRDVLGIDAGEKVHDFDVLSRGYAELGVGAIRCRAAAH